MAGEKLFIAKKAKFYLLQALRKVRMARDSLLLLFTKVHQPHYQKHSLEQKRLYLLPGLKKKVSPLMYLGGTKIT